MGNNPVSSITANGDDAIYTLLTHEAGSSHGVFRFVRYRYVHNRDPAPELVPPYVSHGSASQIITVGHNQDFINPDPI